MAEDPAPLVSSGLRHFLRWPFSEGNAAEPQPELLGGVMGWLQILEHVRDSTDALLKSKMNAGDKVIERWDVLQERCCPQDRSVWQEGCKSSGIIFHCFLSP